MTLPRCLLPLCLLVAAGLATAGQAHAQAVKAGTEALPVWDQSSGKVEAFLLLEPMAARSWQLGGATGQGAASRRGLLCDRNTSLGSIGNLVGNCVVASLGTEARQAAPTAARPTARFGVGVGASRDTLPQWLAPASRTPSRMNQNTLTLIGEKNIGREATVSIGGTFARARLVPADAAPAALTDRWDVKTLSIGTNVGRFGANILGRVVDSPAQSGSWGGLGLGLSWRTPWSGQLSVGAENVITRGKNPFAPSTAGREQATVPYVRYQQDL